MLAAGLCRPGLASLVVDVVTLGPFLSSKSFFHSEPSMLACDSISFDPSLFLQSVGHLDLLILPLDYMFVDLVLLLQSYARLGTAVLILDHVHLGLLASIRSPGYSDTSLLLIEPSQLEVPIFLQSLTCLGLAALVSGVLCAGSFLSAPDLVALELAAPARSHAQMGFSALILQALHLEAVLFSHSFFCVGVLLFVASVARLDFELSVLDFCIHWILFLFEESLTT